MCRSLSPAATSNEPDGDGDGGVAAKHKVPFSEIIKNRLKKFPSSGELNFNVKKPDLVISKIFNLFKKDSEIDLLDGISFTYTDWRFNIRKSNTEPLIRLNVESKKSHKIVKTRLKMISNLIKEFNE